jgi:hypothetical protein
MNPRPNEAEARCESADEWPAQAQGNDSAGWTLRHEYRVNAFDGIHGPMSYEEAVALCRELIEGRAPEIRPPVIESREVGPWLDEATGEFSEHPLGGKAGY